MIDPCGIASIPLLTLEQALARISTSIQPIVEKEKISLSCAYGRVLAETVLSAINLPPERNAAMDGYALSSHDVLADQAFRLNIVGTSWAGKPYGSELNRGECIRVFTGAVIPYNADSVVMQERVEIEKTSIIFPANTSAFENVRQVGEDITQGSPLCDSGKKLTSADIGLLAATGKAEVPVNRQINIAFFTTGDELVGLEQPLQTGKIYDSNRYILTGLLHDPCFVASDLGVIADNKALLKQHLLQAADTHDVIISTGGASVGDADYVQEILAECGEVAIWKIAIKPGKPLIFGTIGKCYFFGLPGNPISMMVTFQQIVAPMLSRLSGTDGYKPLRFKAVCKTNLKKSPGRMEFQRGILSRNDEGEFYVTSSGHQGSHILSTMSRSNCYIILPAESNGVKVNETVLVEPFSLLLT